jgi:hypothetical protein
MNKQNIDLWRIERLTGDQVFDLSGHFLKLLEYTLVIKFLNRDFIKEIKG